ncbi:LysR family transcriptional regulator [Rathayibacter oskolensis]|uniref:LysR family transcriptional regulator n=1 Tax=Rathayibacter oskolensis TaxID=1891671 RepID=UPI00265F6093|nr:LysR family transcriptional regulator [Rathayibacter oskolensis]WKK71547.1 LysR family transcriptional regulator [Rathayibacter oskolensis]
MKISQLRHFVVVAEELHFVRAAEKLGISRKKLDSSVEAVELDDGRVLFEPGAAATTLTAAGRQRLASAREELAALGAEEAAPPKSGGQGQGLQGHRPRPDRQGPAEAVQAPPVPLTRHLSTAAPQ